MNDQTPEERFDAWIAEYDLDKFPSPAIHALRDMIAALDYDLNMQLRALTALDNRVSAMEAER